MANYSQDAQDALLDQAPTAAHVTIAISYVQKFPLGAPLRKRLFTLWAKRVGYEPTPVDYEQVGQSQMFTGTGGR
jgi:hypothetical protein